MLCESGFSTAGMKWFLQQITVSRELILSLTQGLPYTLHSWENQPNCWHLVQKLQYQQKRGDCNGQRSNKEERSVQVWQGRLTVSSQQVGPVSKEGKVCGKSWGRCPCVHGCCSWVSCSWGYLPSLQWLQTPFSKLLTGWWFFQYQITLLLKGFHHPEMILFVLLLLCNSQR